MTGKVLPLPEPHDPGGCTNVSDDTATREIASEQEFVDRVYGQLEKSAAAAQQLAQEGHARGRLGHEGGLVERDAMVFQAAKRIAPLDAAHEGLVFGRLDMRRRGRPGAALHRPDRPARREPRLAADRLARPAAAVFYQATAAEPQDVVRRRVLRSTGADGRRRRGRPARPRAPDDRALPIVGEGALMAQLSRARDRSMHSIVATIQAEQDKAIRAPDKGVVSISGGPGTGKTVVALHRAAYLLYADRRRYETRRRARRRPVRASSCATSSGCCRRSARPRSRCARSARSSTVCARAATTSPAVADVKGSRADGRADASYRAPGGARRARREFRVFYRDDVTRPRPPRARPRSAGSCCRRAAATGSSRGWPPTLLDAHVAPGPRRARPRARPEDVRRRDARATTRSSSSRVAWWPVLDAADGARLAARPRVARPGRRGRARRRGPARCCSKSWARDRASVRRRRRRCSTSCATCSATCRAHGRRRATTRSARSRTRRPAGADHRLRARVRPDRPRLGPADPPHRGRRLRARAHRRGPGPHPDAVADGRPARPRRDLDDRRRPRPVVVAGARRSRPRARAEALGDKPRPRLPPVDQLPQLLGDLRLRRGVRRAGRPRRRPARRGPLDRCRAGGARRRRPRDGGPRRAGRARRLGGGHRRRRRAGRPPGRGQRLAGVVAGARRRRLVAAASTRGAAVGDDRIVVLTGLDTKGLEFDGIVVVAPAGDRGRVGDRPRHALRRAHPRDPAARARCPATAPRSRRDRPDGTSLTGMSEQPPQDPYGENPGGSRPRDPPADSRPMTRTSRRPSRRTASRRRSRRTASPRPSRRTASPRPSRRTASPRQPPGRPRTARTRTRSPEARGLRPGPEPGRRPAAAELPDVRRRPGRDGRLQPDHAIGYGFDKFKDNAGAFLLLALVAIGTGILISIIGSIVTGGDALFSYDSDGFQFGPLAGVFNILGQVAVTLFGAALIRVPSTRWTAARSPSAHVRALGQDPGAGGDAGDQRAHDHRLRAVRAARLRGHLPDLVRDVLHRRPWRGRVTAIKSSFAFASKNVGPLLLLALLSFLCFVAGAIACLVGLLVAYPVVSIAAAYSYRRLQDQPVAA